MENVVYARILIGTSLAFHMVYATLGIGLPLLLTLAEGLSLLTGKEEYHVMARRLSRRAQFLSTIPITIAAAASAAFVISANAWMNTPTGFTLVNGQLTNVYPLAAFFNPAWAHQAIHGILAAYAATGIAVAGYYAWTRWRGNYSPYNSIGLMLAMCVSVVADGSQRKQQGRKGLLSGMSTGESAKHILYAIRTGKEEYHYGGIERLAMPMRQLLPWVYTRMMRTIRK